MKIQVQTQDFDVASELKALQEKVGAGAAVMFVGIVRGNNQGEEVSAMTLEHYPGMTEKALESIAQRACQRWQLEDVTIIHRVGPLAVGDQIVFVGVASAHRGEAFDACEFIMDYLKTEAPFWKKEKTAKGERWVDARESDEAAIEKWQ